MLQNVFTNAGDGVNFNINCNEVYTTSGSGYWSNKVKNVRVTAMGVYIAHNEDDGDGDFYVNYDQATWDNAKDGLIYTDSAFIANVRDKMRDVLLQLNVDDDTANALVADIGYSEQGMQDNGRVSCDAFELTAFLRNYYAKELA